VKKTRFSEEQIVRILQKAGCGDRTVEAVCRDHGVSVNSYYVWKCKYGGLETEDVRRLRELERENSTLKRLLAEKELENDAMKAPL
jgi:putative transposase